MPEYGIYEFIDSVVWSTRIRVSSDPENVNLGLDLIDHKGTVHYSEMGRAEATQLRDLLNQFLGEEN